MKAFYRGLKESIDNANPQASKQAVTSLESQRGNSGEGVDEEEAYRATTTAATSTHQIVAASLRSEEATRQPSLSSRLSSAEIFLNQPHVKSYLHKHRQFEYSSISQIVGDLEIILSPDQKRVILKPSGFSLFKLSMSVDEFFEMHDEIRAQVKEIEKEVQASNDGKVKSMCDELLANVEYAKSANNNEDLNGFLEEIASCKELNYRWSDDGYSVALSSGERTIQLTVKELEDLLVAARLGKLDDLKTRAEKAVEDLNQGLPNVWSQMFCKELPKDLKRAPLHIVRVTGLNQMITVENARGVQLSLKIDDLEEYAKKAQKQPESIKDAQNEAKGAAHFQKRN